MSAGKEIRPRAPGADGRSSVRYHLRVCLNPGRAREEERALWKVLRRGRIDEVMFFVPHAEEQSPGLGTDAENERMAGVLRPLFARLRAKGIAPSINIWWTVSFSEFPGLRRDLRGRFRFRWAVGVDGRESISAACPRCPEWRAQAERMYREYARLEPARLWIDDDVRMTMRADIHSPCFCPECLAEMARRTGRPLDRAALFTAMMADPPNPVRDAWLGYQRALELEIVSRLAAAVHEESPATSVSLMHSGPQYHSAEGRRWGELIEALGSPAPFLRPSIGPYVEQTGPGIASALSAARLAQAAVPEGTTLVPEIENYPHSRHFKSVALVRADLEMGQLLGMREATFSIYRFGGRLDLEVAREDAWSGMLGALKPRLQAMADLGLEAAQARGVSLFWHEEAARHARGVEGEPKPVLMYRQRPWDVALPLMGIAVRYGVGGVTAFAGEEIDCLGDAELDEVFRGGVLLDARAAECLARRGRGDLCGVTARAEDASGSLESIEDPAFGGPAGDVINARWTSLAWQFGLAAGARVISRLRGYEGEDRGHGVVLFENRLGGRTVLVPLDGQAPARVSLGVPFAPLESPSFICRARQAQLRDALEWAGRGALPLFVAGSGVVYPLLSEQPGRLVVGVANLMPDPIDPLVLRLRRPAFAVRRVRVLDSGGRWKTDVRTRIAGARRGAVEVETGVRLGYLDVAALVLD